MSEKARKEVRMTDEIFGGFAIDDEFSCLVEEDKMIRAHAYVTIPDHVHFQTYFEHYCDVYGYEYDMDNTGPRTYSWIYIWDIHVPKKYRRKGIGSNLLKEIEADYNDKHFAVLNIDNPDKKLHAFYIANGFEQLNPTTYIKRYHSLCQEPL